MLEGGSGDTSEIDAGLSLLEFASFELNRSMLILEKLLGLMYRHLDYYRGIHRSLAQQQQAHASTHGFSQPSGRDAFRKKMRDNAHESLQLTIGRVLEE